MSKSKDPAVLWYWNDWHSGTVTFTRHLKGCYMDLLHAQFNNGRLSLSEIKTVLGADFGLTWPTLSKKFMQDDSGNYYNEKAERVKQEREAFLKKQTENGSKGGRPKKTQNNPNNNPNETNIEDGNGNSHSVFCIRLLSKEGEYDKEQIEISTRVKITEELLKQFNANLHNSNVHHYHFSEYKKHLVNWIPKKPKEERKEIIYRSNKPTAMNYLEISNLAKADVAED